MRSGRLALTLGEGLLVVVASVLGLPAPPSGGSAQATTGPWHANPKDLVPSSAVPSGWRQIGTAKALTPDDADNGDILYGFCETIRTVAGTPLKATEADFGLPSGSGGLPSLNFDEEVLRYATTWNAEAEYKVYTNAGAPKCLGETARLEADALAGGHSAATATTTPASGAGTATGAGHAALPPATVTDKFDHSLADLPDSVATTAQVHTPATTSASTTFATDVVTARRGDVVAVFTFYGVTTLLPTKLVRHLVATGVARLP